MFKQAMLGVVATASVAAAVAPVAADARTYHRSHTAYVYRGSNGRYYCHHANGTVGALVGAGVGAVAVGVVTHGAAGPILGAVGGGLLGRHIARHSVHCH